MADWLPPHRRPGNEAAGYLGYYTRVYLPAVFDLVDCDGSWPAVWWYRKAQSGTLRYIEEKLTGQELHGSQERTAREIARTLRFAASHGVIGAGSGVYVIWKAEQLEHARFPLCVTRLASWLGGDRDAVMDHESFDLWLTLPNTQRVEDELMVWRKRELAQLIDLRAAA